MGSVIWPVLGRLGQFSLASFSSFIILCVRLLLRRGPGKSLGSQHGDLENLTSTALQISPLKTPRTRKLGILGEGTPPYLWKCSLKNHWLTLGKENILVVLHFLKFGTD